MKIFLTSKMDTLYKEYYDRTVKLSAKHGIDKTPLGYQEFSRAFNKMKIVTREKRWSAEAIMNKMVKSSVTTTSHRQAAAVVRANPSISYEQARYSPDFWNMVNDEYKALRVGGSTSKEAARAISTIFFNAPDSP